MSKFSDKIKSIFTVDYDEYDDEYYDDYDDDLEPVAPKTTRSIKRTERAVKAEEAAPAPSLKNVTSQPSSHSSRVTKIRSSKVVPMRSNSEMEVCVIKPTYYENTRDIIDTLLEGKSVVLNLEGMKLELAQRIVDSVSGGCYAMHGNLQKISGYIYLVTPSSVDITGDFQDYVSGDNTDYSSTSYSRRNY